MISYDDVRRIALTRPESDPATFFTTDRYDGHPIVLVRLDVDEAAELITESWRLRATKKFVKVWDQQADLRA